MGRWRFELALTLRWGHQPSPIRLNTAQAPTSTLSPQRDNAWPTTSKNRRVDMIEIIASCPGAEMSFWRFVLCPQRHAVLCTAMGRLYAAAALLGASALAVRAAQDTVTIQLHAPWNETPLLLEARYVHAVSVRVILYSWHSLVHQESRWRRRGQSPPGKKTLNAYPLTAPIVHFTLCSELFAYESPALFWRLLDAGTGGKAQAEELETKVCTRIHSFVPILLSHVLGVGVTHDAISTS